MKGVKTMSYNTYPQNPFPPNSEDVGGGGGSYTLPIASTTELGGVKVGENLSINPETGVLDLPFATPENLGGVSIGDGIGSMLGEIYVKLESGGGIQMNADKELYAVPTYDLNTYNFKNNANNIVGRVIVSDNEIHYLNRRSYNVDIATDTYIETGLTNEHVLKIYGFMIDETNNFTDPLPYSGGSSRILFYYDGNNHKIMIDRTGSFSTYTRARIFIEFYETT